MKRVRNIVIFMLSSIALVGCSRTPSFSLDNESWSGTVSRPGNDETFARLTFRQEGRSVEGSLELGQTPDTLIPDSELTGVLEGNSLDMSTATNDTAIFGDFNQEGTTFLGTLRFKEDGEDDDFTLTLSYQQEVVSVQ